MKQTKTKSIFSHFYSPYMSEENKSMSEYYKAFQNDEEQCLWLNGEKYHKIIFRCRYYPKYIENFSLSVLFAYDEPLHINDVLADEKGNEFIIKGTMFIRFSPIPEWYPKLMPLYITGNTYDIGDYLTKKSK